ncbi:hypothetical protein [Propionivibrio sp.]
MHKQRGRVPAMWRITDEILADMASRLVQVADPNKVVLFGSRARGMRK